MSTKRDVKQKIDSLANNLAELVKIFRQGEATNFEWWGKHFGHSMFSSSYGYEAGEPIFDAVVQEILTLNPEMLSQYEVETRLKYDFLKPQTIDVYKPDHLYDSELVEVANTLLTELVKFEAWQDIDVAIANLWPDSEPIQVGKVTFLEVTKEEIEEWKKRGYCPISIDDVQVVARVKSPGDMQKALSYARDEVSLVLDLIRAFCFPFGKKSDMWPVGMLGDFDASRQIPVRINSRDYITLLGGPGIYNNKLRENILTKLTPKQLELIKKLINNSNRSNMEKKLFDSIHWLAEATKTDTDNAKFAKISFALETLIAGEPEDEELKVRGITAMLAERAAFIAGRKLDDRLAIDKDIRTYYGKRSKIVHGGEGDVSLDDIDKFGQLVRRLALALLEKLDELGDEIGEVEKLERWVKVQKYTTPDHNNKEVSCHSRKLKSG